MIADYNWAPIGIACSINDDVLPENTPADTQLEYADVSTVSYGSIGKAEEVTFRSAPSRARRLTQSGDVVVSTVRTYLRAIAAVGGKESNYVFSTGFAVLRPRENLTNSRYLSYAMGSTPVIDSIISNSNGVGYPAINPTDLARVRIPLPSLQTQHRIAEYLDRETQQIDESITRIDKVVQLLEERRSSELNLIILSGVREDNTRQLRSDWIPYISAEWSTTQLGVLGRLRTGLTLGKHWDEHTKEYPYLRVANVQVGELDLSEVKSVSLPPRIAQDFAIPHSAVLMTEGGDRDKLGRGTIWNSEIPGCLHQNHIFAFECGPLLSPHFLVAYLESQYARKYFELTSTQATNLASTNSTKVKALPVPLPEIGEQKEIVAHLNTLDQEHRRMTASATRTKELLQEHRAALITAAVTGKIEV